MLGWHPLQLVNRDGTEDILHGIISAFWPEQGWWPPTEAQIGCLSEHRIKCVSDQFRIHIMVQISQKAIFGPLDSSFICMVGFMICLERRNVMVQTQENCHFGP